MLLKHLAPNDVTSFGLQQQGAVNISYLGLSVSLLDGVSCDFCVAIVLRWGPFQGCVEAPSIDQLHAGRRTRQL